MKQFILKNKKTLGGIIGILLIGGVTMSFQESPFTINKFVVQDEYNMEELYTDTVPDKECCNGTIKMKDFEKLQGDLDKSLLQVSDELKKIDFEKIQKQVESSLKELDMDKIMASVERSLKSIDLDKLLEDVKSSLKDIRWEDQNGVVEKALNEAREEIEKAKFEIKDIDREDIKKELEKAKLELENTRHELNKIDMDGIMGEARQAIDKAKTELRETKAMFDEMEKDGLVDHRKGFTIEYKNKDLYIDGKKQPEKITDKYRRYFKGDHFKMTIEKE